MCGIIGIKLFHQQPKKSDQSRVEKGLLSQQHRGPDFTAVNLFGKTVLGHNRLAIIDVNERSNQPFKDISERYSLVFNGEIYNYPELKNNLLGKGVVFNTSSDTEVLLYHLIENGENGIKDLNGCFAFAFYDKETDVLILARDHIGINPLLFSIQENELLFASELHAFKSMLNKWSINKTSLNDYFRFTYVPAPKTMLNEVQKLLPGHYLKVDGSDFDIVNYYTPQVSQNKDLNYPSTVEKLKKVVEQAVIKRLNADVPVGAFLSGGLDSSIVSAIAAGFKTELNTYSIGFKGNNFFDETVYANKVASHIGSNHHSIQLEEKNILNQLNKVLESFDEPFADSSAIAMYFLSREVKQKLTVCLSGDGADELFAGYNKHKAFLKSQKPNVLLRSATTILGGIDKGSRSGKMSNKFRQLSKFKTLLKQKWPEKYWFLATFIPYEDRSNLLKDYVESTPSLKIESESLNNFLVADQKFILPNDMLKKVDLMSMKHSLEVRTPFLDKEVVDYANSLPEEFKFKNGIGKRLLRDAFKDMLPEEIFSRSKKGFEVPLQDWVSNGWDFIVNKKWFEKNFLEDQNLFNFQYVIGLKNKFFGKNPGESATIMWAYIVFQNWYSRWTEK
ncbi:MAG: asparagine synthase (glutamine-hydrolyzing) [Brumimicrobium sp.]